MSDNNPPDPAAKASLVFALKQLLPSDRVIHETEALRPYECDGLPAYRQMPLVAVLPDSVEQVQQIMQLCHKRKIPVVARGTATSLSGGALPLADRVLLGLAKFNKILDIDTANRTALVQPGVRNLAISEVVAADGLYYAPTPPHRLPAPSAVRPWTPPAMTCWR